MLPTTRIPGNSSVLNNCTNLLTEFMVDPTFRSSRRLKIITDLASEEDNSFSKQD
jgi:hypothetical protein